jgi:hypothetical protein
LSSERAFERSSRPFGDEEGGFDHLATVGMGESLGTFTCHHNVG